MSDVKLSALETSRLGDEFKALPRDERRRISRANDRGIVLPTERERNLQRALLAQLPRWIVILLGIMLPLQAMNAWTSADHSTIQLIGAIACTVATPLIWWNLWARRRLTRQLETLNRPEAETPKDA